MPGGVDPSGLTKLWTFSGINNVDPRNNEYLDYVGASMILLGHQPDFARASHAGNVAWYDSNDPRNNPKNFLDQSRGNNRQHDARYISALGSRNILDQDAGDRAEDLFGQTGSLCNPCGSPKILVVMAAPKTKSLPKEGCCDVTVISWVNALDSVPNQESGPGATPEWWVQNKKTGWPALIKDNEQKPLGMDFDGDGKEDGPGSGAHLEAIQNYWDQWGNANVFSANDPNDFYNHHIRNFQAAIDHAGAEVDSGNWDHVFVCHSQGCNIAMKLLPKICNWDNY